jgi:hypothetical protein
MRDRCRLQTIDIREYKDFSLACPACLFWLSSYVASHHLAVALQTVAKGKVYCTVYSITLNSNCEAQGMSKGLFTCESNFALG